MYAVANGMSKLDLLLAGTLVSLRCSWGRWRSLHWKCSCTSRWSVCWLPWTVEVTLSIVPQFLPVEFPLLAPAGFPLTAGRLSSTQYIDKTSQSCLQTCSILIIITNNSPHKHTHQQSNQLPHPKQTYKIKVTLWKTVCGKEWRNNG